MLQHINHYIPLCTKLWHYIFEPFGETDSTCRIPYCWYKKVRAIRLYKLGIALEITTVNNSNQIGHYMHI